GFEGGKVLWPSEWTKPHDRDEKVRKQYPIWAQIPPEQLRIEPGRRHQHTGVPGQGRNGGTAPFQDEGIGREALHRQPRGLRHVGDEWAPRQATAAPPRPDRGDGGGDDVLEIIGRR